MRQIPSGEKIEKLEKLVSELRAIRHWDTAYRQSRSPGFYEMLAFVSRQERRRRSFVSYLDFHVTSASLTRKGLCALLGRGACTSCGFPLMSIVKWSLGFKVGAGVPKSSRLIFLPRHIGLTSIVIIALSQLLGDSVFADRTQFTQQGPPSFLLGSPVFDPWPSASQLGIT